MPMKIHDSTCFALIYDVIHVTLLAYET